jgi:hypothetical protein
LRRWLGGEPPLLLAAHGVSIDAAGERAARAGEPEVFLAPTLRAPVPPAARSGRLRAWLPLGLLLVAGAGIVGRSQRLASSAPASEAHEEASAPRTRADLDTSKAGHARRRRPAPPRKSTANATATAMRKRAPVDTADAGHAGALPAIDQEAPAPEAPSEPVSLNALQSALEARAVMRAAAALRDLRERVPDHTELPALTHRFTELAAREVDALHERSDCAGLQALASAAAEAGVSPTSWSEALRNCAMRVEPLPEKANSSTGE